MSIKDRRRISELEYREAFSSPEGFDSDENESRARKALEAALDIRKLEINLYWTRAAYFWAFIAAAFAGYAFTYKTAANGEPWLSLLFSSLGLVFSYAWYLVNRGSKFWQSNWECHVDLLEGMSLGPLYKYVALTPENDPFTSAGQFSVTKINQMLSIFVAVIWLLLFTKAAMPLSLDLPFDFFKFSIIGLTIAAIFILRKKGRSNFGVASYEIIEREYTVNKPNN